MYKKVKRGGPVQQVKWFLPLSLVSDLVLTQKARHYLQIVDSHAIAVFATELRVWKYRYSPTRKGRARVYIQGISRPHVTQPFLYGATETHWQRK